MNGEAGTRLLSWFATGQEAGISRDLAIYWRKEGRCHIIMTAFFAAAPAAYNKRRFVVWVIAICYGNTRDYRRRVRAGWWGGSVEEREDIQEMASAAEALM